MKTLKKLTKMNLNQLKEHFLDGYEDVPDELVLELEISTQELLDRFEDKVLEYLEANYETEEEPEKE